MADEDILIGAADGAPQTLALKYANRHGLIAGATGTGKTVTSQILAEGFSAAGVPVFLADVKGDLAGVSRPGAADPRLASRAAETGVENYAPAGAPARFWDLFGEAGHPARTTATEMGPLTFSRLLNLNDAQEGLMALVYRLADDEGLPLLDLKDLRAILASAATRSRALSARYGLVSRPSVAAIQRRLLALEDQGGAAFFGEPALRLEDLMAVDASGAGVVNVLAADRLMQAPKTYAAFLLWLLSELFEELPEVGDAPKPKLAFFFDEAHLLFHRAPTALVDKISQVVRLIRSKGVAVFFVTQNPLDVPDAVSSQLGARIVHGLRAYTPRERRVLKAAAETFRANPAFNAEETIAALGVGEALVSTLGPGGVPTIAERVKIRPPTSRMGPITAAERAETMAASPLGPRYDAVIDRESAYELLAERAERAARLEEAAEREAPRRRAAPRGRSRQTVTEAAVKSAVRSFSRTIARELARGLLGGLKRRRR